jgi:hypothetical protein
VADAPDGALRTGERVPGSDGGRGAQRPWRHPLVAGYNSLAAIAVGLLQ